MMGRRKRDGNHSPPKNKLVQDLEENEESRYPDPDTNKTKINYAKEPNEAYKNTPKKEILQVINENFIEMLLDMVNQNVEEALKKFHDNKNKEYEKTQKQINELIGALNKHQSETENTINTENNKLKTKIDNVKASEKKNQTEIKTHIGRPLWQTRRSRRQNFRT
jgi:hypothetical protein